MNIINNDNSKFLISKIKNAYKTKTSLKIESGNSKKFYGRKITHEALDVSTHTGIRNYEPSELVITVRAGTTLVEINSTLNNNNQMLPFDPPCFNANSTIGGTIACGLSGSRRPFAGAVRDFILGTRIVNGKGESLRFGGEVIKNVAGYDASRLMTGALGTLGLLLDVSLKVLPKPELEKTLVQTLSIDAALPLMTHLKRQAIPVSGLVYYANNLFIRLSGSQNAVDKAINKLGGETLTNSNYSFSWAQLDNHSLDFFNSNQALWRISVKSNTPILNIKGDCIYGWAGAERWILSNEDNNKIFNHASKLNGHATLFRFGDRKNEIFQPLPAALKKLHIELKKSFDPENILNPGKLYSEI